MSSDQAQAQALFASRSFFLLSKLPHGSEFGVDGKLFVVDKFEGVKFLTPSLHLFVFSAAPSTVNDTPQSISSGLGVRYGILRFFQGAGETVVEEWDNAREQLVGDDSRRPRRRYDPRASEGEPRVVISQDYLKTLDKHLAPYMPDKDGAWENLVNFITQATLMRVIGIDQRGNARVDTVMGTNADQAELKSAGGKQTWGKRRLDEVDEEGLEAPDEMDDLDILRFVQPEKKSWPEGAIGEELSRWSQDKSWALSDAITRLGLGSAAGVKELLAELQLAFVLFIQLQSYSSLAVYKSIFSLLCRSSSLLLPPASRNPSAYSAALLANESLPLYASFFSVLVDQFRTLEEDFFSVQMPGLDMFLLTELDHLCVALSDASLKWNELGGAGGAIWKVVVERWDALAALTMKRYGWTIGIVQGSRAYAELIKSKGSDRDDEVDLEDLEEGEDAPVIVDM